MGQDTREKKRKQIVVFALLKTKLKAKLCKGGMCLFEFICLLSCFLQKVRKESGNRVCAELCISRMSTNSPYLW